jgi:hypothetical protein
MASSSITPRLLSAKKAAEYVGLPYTSLRDCVFRGEIAVVRFGAGSRQRWYFQKSDLDKLVDSHTTKGVA